MKLSILTLLTAVAVSYGNAALSAPQALDVTNIKQSADRTSQKPNILLLVADDTAFADIGAYGSVRNKRNKAQ